MLQKSGNLFSTAKPNEKQGITNKHNYFFLLLIIYKWWTINMKQKDAKLFLTDLPYCNEYIFVSQNKTVSETNGITIPTMI